MNSSLVTDQGRGPGSLDLSTAAAWAVGAGGVAILLITAVDFGTLWLFQRQEVPQWEFVAATSTIEGFTRVTMGTVMLFLAVYLARPASMTAMRVVGSLSILFGLAAAGLGLLLVFNYLTLASIVGGAGGPTAPLATVLAKGLTLSVVFTAAFAVMAIVGMRRPRTR